MSMEAYRCLIENDAHAGAALGKAVMTAMRIDQATATKRGKRKNRPAPSTNR